ncbi:hypothetical protein EVAR_49442_1 [Eumeta japonica]|uniref:Uncharacterized protein n=1 Tax=Eumeta variegata TaxID=151549 RepID=A0A4C1Y3D0_EUMVA|nr:hypothetical protein EVAR_49442_1 [Eumeta japonica]
MNGSATARGAEMFLDLRVTRDAVAIIFLIVIIKTYGFSLSPPIPINFPLGRQPPLGLTVRVREFGRVGLQQGTKHRAKHCSTVALTKGTMLCTRQLYLARSRVGSPRLFVYTPDNINVVSEQDKAIAALKSSAVRRLDEIMPLTSRARLIYARRSPARTFLAVRRVNEHPYYQFY